MATLLLRCIIVRRSGIYHNHMSKITCATNFAFDGGKVRNRHYRSLQTTAVSKISENELFQLPKDPNQGSRHWLTERIVTVGLLVAVPIGVVYPSPLIDHSLAVFLPLHAYWGVNAVISDYLFRPLVAVAKLFWGLTCALSLVGLIYLNVHDIGICKSVAMIMKI